MVATKSRDREQINWHALEVDLVLDSLQVRANKGLDLDLAAEKLALFGTNELTKTKKDPWWLKFLKQFNQPLLYILIVAGLTKALLGEWVNAGVIWGVTIANAAIGYLQEAKAEDAIAALASSMTTETTVIRNGQIKRLPSRELVPGDLVILEAGDKVPADLRAIEVNNLQIDESHITGESVPISKSIELVENDVPLGDRTSMAYAGGLVTFGNGIGVVVATGQNTETGQISQLLDKHNNLSTPLTRKMDKFSKKWLYMVLGLAIFTFVLGIRFQELKDALEAAVALTVSAVPEGLPAVITVTLAISVSRMAQRHAIIRKLPAVETLGSTTVICSDKTGTLTQNKMTVKQVFAGGKNYCVEETEIVPVSDSINSSDRAALEQCLRVGLLCNDARAEYKEGKIELLGDPTEKALIISAEVGGLNQQQMQQEMPRIDSIPFASEHQYMATLHRCFDDRIAYIKGSPEVVLKRCQFMAGDRGEYVDLDRDEIEKQVRLMGEQGLRVLAFAEKLLPSDRKKINPEDIESELIFLGLQGTIDPPRQSAIDAVKACQKAGIQVKMITGDRADTASAIAGQMGITKNGSLVAYTGAELAKMNPQQLTEAVEEASVFARVAPQQKLILVEALQNRGEIVAMTGDGVNDAPALKQADIGIAMGNGGTEVAKEAADIVLTDDNFASIEAAVEEGRAVYKNLLQAITFILPVNVGESMSILFATMLARELPILSLQILWLNTINSVAMTVPLAFEPKSATGMEKPPRQPNEPILSRSRIGRILAIALFNWIVIFGVFESVKVMTSDIDLARTMAINALISGRIFYLLSLSQLVPNLILQIKGKMARTWQIPAIGYGIIAAIALQIVFTQAPLMNQIFATTPLSSLQWSICFLIGCPMIFWAAIVNRFDPVN
ncbi:MAG: HAD-IC family P-type ATPase [Prochloraceae cyanobacterium]|nr:HAD-IC family P-type ATPase [Prochloraceae cyanobacterium]